MHHSNLHFCPHIASVSVSVFLRLKSPSSSYKDTGVGYRVHPKSTLISSQILNYIFKIPISKYGHIHSWQGLGLRCVLRWRDTIRAATAEFQYLPSQAGPLSVCLHRDTNYLPKQQFVRLSSQYPKSHMCLFPPTRPFIPWAILISWYSAFLGAL